ncbi:hypothetical protein [Rhizobacter sp. P5_C2]
MSAAGAHDFKVTMMGKNAIASKIASVSPVLPVVALYAALLLVVATVDRWPGWLADLGPLKFIFVGLLVVLPLWSFVAAIVNLAKRRDVTESIVALVLLIPVALVWEGGIERRLFNMRADQPAASNGWQGPATSSRSRTTAFE